LLGARTLPLNRRDRHHLNRYRQLSGQDRNHSYPERSYCSLNFVVYRVFRSFLPRRGQEVVCDAAEVGLGLTRQGSRRRVTNAATTKPLNDSKHGDEKCRTQVTAAVPEMIGDVDQRETSGPVVMEQAMQR